MPAIACGAPSDSDYMSAGSLEMLLLLLWRHLVFYCEGYHLNNPDLKGAVSHAMRLALSPDAETLQAEAARKLVPMLQRLQALDLVRPQPLLTLLRRRDEH